MLDLLYPPLLRPHAATLPSRDETYRHWGAPDDEDLKGGHCRPSAAMLHAGHVQYT